MKLRFSIIALATFALSLCVACSDEEDTILTSQHTSILNYLSSAHVPKLIALQNIEESMEAEPHFYELFDQNIYRYISTYYDEGRSSRAIVERGDEVKLTFSAYLFTGGLPSISSLYASNDPKMIAQLTEQGLDTQFWSSEPLTIKIGETDIIKGVEVSLIGCREGDRVEVYLAYPAGYGSHELGLLTKEQPLVWIYTIDSLTKH